MAGLVGRGPGLTPSGDDALAGALLVAHALGTGRGARGCRARPARCHHRGVGRPARRRRRRLRRPTGGHPRRRRRRRRPGCRGRALPAVLAIGHTSGADHGDRHPGGPGGADPGQLGAEAVARAATSAPTAGRRPDGAPHDDPRRAAPRRLPRLGEPDAGLPRRRRHRGRRRRPGGDGDRAQRRRAARHGLRRARRGRSQRPRRRHAGRRRRRAGCRAGRGRRRARRRCAAPATRASGGDDEVAPRTLGSAAARCRREPGGHLGARPARRHRGLRRHRRGPERDAVLRQRLRRRRGAPQGRRGRRRRARHGPRLRHRPRRRGRARLRQRRAARVGRRRRGLRHRRAAGDVPARRRRGRAEPLPRRRRAATSRRPSAGRSTRQALRALADDPATETVLLVSKPPDDAVLADIEAYAAELGPARALGGARRGPPRPHRGGRGLPRRRGPPGADLAGHPRRAGRRRRWPPAPPCAACSAAAPSPTRR